MRLMTLTNAFGQTIYVNPAGVDLILNGADGNTQMFLSSSPDEMFSLNMTLAAVLEEWNDAYHSDAGA